MFKFIKKYLELRKENEILKSKLSKFKLKRGDVIYLKNEMILKGYLYSFKRPYIVVSNNIGNDRSNIILIVPLTSKNNHKNMPTHCIVSYHNSIAICEQIFSINQSEVNNIVYHLKKEDIIKINNCLKIALSLKRLV